VVAGISQVVLSIAVGISYAGMQISKPRNFNWTSGAADVIAQNPVVALCAGLVSIVALLRLLIPSKRWECFYTRSTRHIIIWFSVLPYIQQAMLLGELSSYTNPIVQIILTILLASKSNAVKRILKPRLPKEAFLTAEILLRSILLVLECKCAPYETNRIVFLTCLWFWHSHLNYQTSEMKNSALTWALYYCTADVPTTWTMSDFLKQATKFFTQAPLIVPDKDTCKHLMIARCLAPALYCAWLNYQGIINTWPLLVLGSLCAWESYNAINVSELPATRLNHLLGIQLKALGTLVDTPHHVTQYTRNWAYRLVRVPLPETVIVPTTREIEQMDKQIEDNIACIDRIQANQEDQQNLDQTVREPEVLIQRMVNGEVRTLVY
jgi:hypothetical protein